jgi:hypothetical protein
MQSELTVYAHCHLRVNCGMVGEAITHYNNKVRDEERKETRMSKFCVDFDGILDATVGMYPQLFRAGGSGFRRQPRGRRPPFRQQQYYDSQPQSWGTPQQQQPPSTQGQSATTQLNMPPPYAPQPQYGRPFRR